MKRYTTAMTHVSAKRSSPAGFRDFHPKGLLVWTLILSGLLWVVAPATRAALVISEDFEGGTPKFGWYLDGDNEGTRYMVVQTNEVFGSMALHYHLDQTSTGQQNGIGQLLTPVDMSSDSISSLTVQFDFYLDNPAAPLKKAFNFGIGTSSGTPLTDNNQLQVEGWDDRGYNAYIGWQLPYCRIQYQTTIGTDGHGRGGTLVTVDPAPIMIPGSLTIGTARMTLTKGADDTYEIKVEYRVGSDSFVTGATGTYAQLATSFDQIVVGFGIHSAPEGSEIYIDNVLVYTNNDPSPEQPAAQIQYQVVNGQLTLTWPTNAGWRLLGQTNALGLASGPSAWFQVGGASDGYFAQPLSPGAGAVFYRLVTP